jgi:hypothetical protein
MWEIQKRVMRAKRVILNNSWEVDEGKRTEVVKGRVMYGFLETLSDLANNKTGKMACGIPAICRASGLSRSTVIRCLAIARRHRFITDTGETLPPPYETIVYQMEPRIFMLLAKGYLDTSYASVEEVMEDLGFTEKTAHILFFQHDVLSRFMEKHPDGGTDDQYLEMAKPYWRPGLFNSRRTGTTWEPKPSESRSQYAVRKRNLFLKVCKEMDKEAQNWVTPTFVEVKQRVSA